MSLTTGKFQSETMIKTREPLRIVLLMLKFDGHNQHGVDCSQKNPRQNITHLWCFLGNVTS